MTTIRIPTSLFHVFTTYEKGKKQKMIINLVGSKIPVKRSSFEIKYFCQEKQLVTSIIKCQSNIFSEIYNVRPDIIINECGILNCEEIVKMHYKNTIYSFNIYKNYTFYIDSELCESDKNTKNMIRKCKHLDNIYHLDTSMIDKRNMINMYLY
jgi:hypothetical protein